MTDRYAVFGHPVAHSKSPRIHSLFAEQTGEQLSYEALEAPLEDFSGCVRRFVAAGGRGANVTVPFKHEAAELADQLSDRARFAGAVNTLCVTADGLYGDNTDGVGLVRDLVANLGVVLEGRRLLLLGAGGAAQGVMAPLLAEQPALLHVANRTADKALASAAHFSALGEVSGGGLDALTGMAPFDVAINATSASLHGAAVVLPEYLLAPGGLAYDMMYGAEPTAFMQALAGREVRTVDGLGMLVEQAAAAFALWRGVTPNTAPVLRLLRAELR